MNSNFREGEMIRRMNAKEVQKLVKWAGDEGWNPGINDALSFWNLDPEGFLAIADNDKVIGGRAMIRHGDNFGFMGLFIVKILTEERGWERNCGSLGEIAYCHDSRMVEPSG